MNNREHDLLLTSQVLAVGLQVYQLSPPTPETTQNYGKAKANPSNVPLYHQYVPSAHPTQIHKKKR